MTSREEAIDAIAQMEFRVDVNATNAYWVAPKILDHPTVEAYYREKIKAEEKPFEASIPLIIRCKNSPRPKKRQKHLNTQEAK